MTTADETEGRVYSLSTSHYFEWSDVEDLVPEAPEVPDELLPPYPTGEAVSDVDSLQIHAFRDQAPYFPEDSLSVEATPQEVAEWQAAWGAVQAAQQTYRQRLEWARRAYEAAARDALADLTESMKPWRPIEADLKDRAMKLAAKLHSHRVAAREYAAQKEAREQEHLDTIHGPRALALYRPKSLNSYNRADHVARVHMVTCGRRPALPASIGETRHEDEGLRANEAWHRLTHPTDWIGLLSDREASNMRVKFCANCKPWTVFTEHLEDFPRPRYDGRNRVVLGDLELSELPRGWV